MQLEDKAPITAVTSSDDNPPSADESPIKVRKFANAPNTFLLMQETAALLKFNMFTCTGKQKRKVKAAKAA